MKQLMNEKEIVYWLANLRKEKGISIEEVSNVSGLTQNVISRLEATEKTYSSTTYKKYMNTIMKLTDCKWKLS